MNKAYDLAKLFWKIFKYQRQKIISGEQAFKLYDTYGFPLELTNDIASEHGYTVDSIGFEKTHARTTKTI